MNSQLQDIEKLIDHNDLDGAFAKVEEILAADQYQPEALAYRAKIYYKQKDFEKAIDAYNHLINLMPTNPELIADRGLAYHMHGAYKEALADFDTSVELEPNNPYWYACRAFIKGHNKDYKGSLKDYEKVLLLDPNDAIALNNKGLVEEKLGYMEKSQKSFNQADEIEGIDLEKEIGHLQIPVEPKPEVVKQSPVQHFISVLSSLFTSAEERRKFASFLFGSKSK